jgi:hypothetical protein
MSSSIEVTSIGPVAKTVRDEFADYRDRNDHPNYNAALEALLEEADAEA